MAVITRLVPRLGWSRTSESTPPSTPTTGHRVRRGSSISRQRRARRSATNEDQGDLGQLRGLERHRTGPDPAPGAVDRLAHGQHGDQQHHHDDQAHPAPPAPGAPVAVEGGQQAGQADHCPDALADAVAPGGAGLLQGDDRRRRQDHHQAEQDQHGDHRGQDREGAGGLTRRRAREGDPQASGPGRGGGVGAGGAPAQGRHGRHDATSSWSSGRGRTPAAAAARAKSSPRSA